MEPTTPSPENGLTPLADISRQALRVGTPPVFIFTEKNQRISLDLVQLSVQLRQVEALERIADALETTDSRSALEESVRIFGGGQQS